MTGHWLPGESSRNDFSLLCQHIMKIFGCSLFHNLIRLYIHFLIVMFVTLHRDALYPYLYFNFSSRCVLAHPIFQRTEFIAETQFACYLLSSQVYQMKMMLFIGFYSLFEEKQSVFLITADKGCSLYYSGLGYF